MAWPRLHNPSASINSMSLRGVKWLSKYGWLVGWFWRFRPLKCREKTPTTLYQQPLTLWPRNNSIQFTLHLPNNFNPKFTLRGSRKNNTVFFYLDDSCQRFNLFFYYHGAKFGRFGLPGFRLKFYTAPKINNPTNWKGESSEPSTSIFCGFLNIRLVSFPTHLKKYAEVKLGSSSQNFAGWTFQKNLWNNCHHPRNW